MVPDVGCGSLLRDQAVRLNGVTTLVDLNREVQNFECLGVTNHGAVVTDTLVGQRGIQFKRDLVAGSLRQILVGLDDGAGTGADEALTGEPHVLQHVLE